MNRAKGQSVAIREELVERMGTHVVDVAEFDLVLASLRVRKMARGAAAGAHCRRKTDFDTSGRLPWIPWRS